MLQNKRSVLVNSTVTQQNTFLQQFQKVCYCIKVTANNQLVILGVPLGDADKRDLLSTKIEDLVRVSNTLTHIIVLSSAKLFSKPKLLYFLRTNTSFAEKDLRKQYNYILKKAPSKATNVCFTDTLFTQSVLPSSQSV